MEHSNNLQYIVEKFIVLRNALNNYVSNNKA